MRQNLRHHRGLRLYPDSFLQPAYRISPFQTEYVAFNAALPKDDFASVYFDNRFGKDNWSYTCNGREAIHLALEQYQLQPTDLVTILTTSENFYISSCVTKTIEIFCQWNREILPETKIIFVNHEFASEWRTHTPSILLIGSCICATQ